ncbi:hypothetical protein TREMEDRAFT_58876 [Tremella mesenterica DSM 1558]|uniref:uncharacterized protein n=1 Tax=Tremella mesenterica (strain ATCC 24925 / CBS 8224 / DSM 1558 / NBRC 9311 / NRRL Y-6157 / RJB 2259-6 / UBC 559-6) TaxID=578456 RepID=UPI0003F4A009|nr:uncharacterized protein TREMEDRAFT_58876 [Tremella mesenterica DSM 1558]EIW72707.1 hypothetical protein TREMEDRAFT_58876 [Tremella mesenterica DSM 1558]
MSSQQTTYDDDNITPSELAKVPGLTAQALHILSQQDRQSMALGDFTAELRDLDIRGVVIDEVLTQMTTYYGARIWVLKRNGELWISLGKSQSNNQNTGGALGLDIGEDQ